MSAAEDTEELTPAEMSLMANRIELLECRVRELEAKRADWANKAVHRSEQLEDVVREIRKNCALMDEGFFSVGYEGLLGLADKYEAKP